MTGCFFVTILLFILLNPIMQRFLTVLFHLFIRLLKISCILKICCFSPRFCELQQQRNYMLETTSQNMVFSVYCLVLYPACRLAVRTIQALCHPQAPN